MAYSHITSWQVDWQNKKKNTNRTVFTFLGSKITEDGDLATILKDTAPWEKKYDQVRQCIKMQIHHFANKGPYSHSYGFSSSQVWM